MNAPSTRPCPQCGKAVAVRLPKCPFCNAALAAVEEAAPADASAEKPASTGVVVCPRCRMPYSFAKNPAGCPHCTKNPAFAALSARELAEAERKAGGAGGRIFTAGVIKVAAFVIAPLVFGAFVWQVLSSRGVPEVPTRDDKIFELLVAKGSKGLLNVETPQGVFIVPGTATVVQPADGAAGRPRTEEGCELTPGMRISTVQHRKTRGPGDTVISQFRFVDMSGTTCGGGWIRSAFLKPTPPPAPCPPPDGSCADGATATCAP